MTLLDNLIAYYTFDLSNSNDSIAGLNGTDSDMTYAAGSGKINNGATFNGTSGKISLPSGVYSLFNAKSAWSVNMWVKPSAGGKYPWCSNASAAADGNSRQIVGCDTDTFFIYRTDGASGDQMNSSTSRTFNGSNWFMVTATYDGSTMRLYVNGSLDCTPMASSKSAPTQGIGIVGANIASNTYSYYGGAVDELGFWSRALSAAEVTSLYNSGSGKQYPFGLSTGNFLAFF